METFNDITDELADFDENVCSKDRESLPAPPTFYSIGLFLFFKWPKKPFNRTDDQAVLKSITEVHVN